jgi:hypothetical protein
MAHLTAARLVDLAEDARAESSVPHLAECDRCRRALAELRATMADVADVQVPEPSPLFWDHLSARVRDGVAEQGAPDRARWIGYLLRPRLALPLLASSLAAVIVAAVMLTRAVVPNPIPSTPLPVPSIAESGQLPSLPPLEPLGVADDPSLGLVADFGTTLGWDDMREEMVTDAGGSDRAVIGLGAEERQELQRLLEQEMAQPTALGTSS